jgi:organic radical activating enzyme
VIDIPFISFHITNQCNLNCSNCYTLSNYDFTGHSLWEDHREYYTAWSKKINLGKFAIYGGEPLLNPTVLDWFNGVANLWPDAVGEMTTNGYALNEKNKELYDVFKNSNGKYYLHISHHNPDTIDFLFKKINNWIVGPITTERVYIDKNEIIPFSNDYATIPHLKENLISSYNKVRSDSWPEINSLDDWEDLAVWIKEECIQLHHISPQYIAEKTLSWKIVDLNGVMVIVTTNTHFETGALILKEDQSGFKWHQSNPIKAHDVCGNRNCIEFYNGSLHKCNTAGHFEEFQKQFKVDLDEVDLAILKDYQPATIDMSENELKTWITDLKNPIAQCRFCPETKNHQLVKSTTKKIFLKKRE